MVGRRRPRGALGGLLPQPPAWSNPKASRRPLRRGGQLHGDAEPAGIPGREGESSVVGLRDALDDREAEPDTAVVGAHAVDAAKKRLGKRGGFVRAELLAGTLA